MSESFTYQASDAGKRLAVRVSGAIGGSLFSDDGVTSDRLSDALNSAPGVEDIDVDLESKGGDFFEGVRMYQMLSEHPARVHVSIGSIAASAASVIAMAGDDIVMHETSSMLVHKARAPIFGTDDEMRKKADSLSTLNEAMAIAYASRSGMDPEKVRALMAENRIIGAKEAFALGLCTEIRKAKNGPQAVIEADVLAEIELMRTKAMASAAALQIAAMAPPTTTKDPTPAPSAPEGTNGDTMQNAVVIAALNLTEGATDSDVLSAITNLKASADASNKLVAALGVKSADEALGTVAALQANLSQVDSAGHTKVLAALDSKNADEALGKIGALMGARERLAAAEAKLDALGKQAEQTERDEIVAKLEADGKCTPKQVAELFPNLNLAGLKAFAATAVPILKGDGKREAKSGAQKSYAEMSNTERAELHASDPELFKQLRAEAQANGSL